MRYRADRRWDPLLIYIVIEYKPREPRVHMSFDSLARTLLGIEKIGLPNVGILLDFGHALFGAPG